MSVVDLGEVTVIIPQFGRVELTANCVSQLAEYHPDLGRILVVDDGSSTDQLRLLQTSRFPCVEIIRNSLRRGVTSAWNSGAKAVRTRWSIFLNNDVKSAGPWIRELVTPLADSETSVQMTGVALRSEPEFPSGLILRNHAPHMLEGWCFAIEMTTLRRLKGFDTRFMLYFSDTDLQCRLLQEHAAPLRVVRGLPLQHLVHQSTKLEKHRREIWQADRQRFVNKWSHIN